MIALFCSNRLKCCAVACNVTFVFASSYLRSKHLGLREIFLGKKYNIKNPGSGFDRKKDILDWAKLLMKLGFLVS